MVDEVNAPMEMGEDEPVDIIEDAIDAEAQAEEDAQDEFDDEDEAAETQTDDSGSEPPVEPEAPSEAASESDEDLIAQAVGMSYADFRKRHFMTAKVLTARMGDPVVFLTESLGRDEDYKALLHTTESDIDASRIAKVVVKIALGLAEKILIT